ncbi:MAG: sensor domain-containing protein [Mycobacterium pseudokansasii]|uniref:sensor domain-containing protein n=1 Tax=Mycobacterium pseudokansasii TaxID=2341080 RepID=UPI0023F4997B|nr:sensor domain-containing protein [Mycobacterium pseudokansasii]MBY0386890.1 sensor domain-containing protein [Mycobacterium pseudokansasii]
MAIFISYSSQDRSSLEALTAALRRAQQQVWFDQELGGGDAWWNKILEQIRASDVFIVALSNHWLQSKPSQAELRYAQALQRPILPVQVGPVDSVRVNPVSTLQIINYQNPTVDAGIQLVTAIHALRDKVPPLPSPLPEEPPVPFGYLMRLGDTLAEKELSPQQQLQMLVELRSGLDEDGDDPSARSDIAQLLRMLRMRHDVTYRTRTEIDNVLAEIGAVEAGPAGAASAPQATPLPSPAPAAEAASSTPSRPAPAPVAASGATGQSNKRLLVIGGAVVAVVVAVALIAVFATQGGGRKPAAKPGGSTAPAAPAASSRIEPMLLGAAEVGQILGDQNMLVSAHGDQLRTPQGTLSEPACLAAYEPLQESVYRTHSPSEVRSQVLHTQGENPAHRVIEAAAVFPSAEKARAFVQASADKWAACANQTVKFTSSTKTSEWTFGDVTGASPKIAQVRTETDGSGKACQHVLRAVSDVVIEVEACGTDIADGAGQIAEQMSAKAAK